MQNRWTHKLCNPCWVDWTEKRGQPGRRAVVVRDDTEAPCCGCGLATTSGIYVRGEPTDFHCYWVKASPGARGQEVEP